MSDPVPTQDMTSLGAVGRRPLSLPTDLQRLIAETQIALSSALAERITAMCDDAFQVGYDRGWHEGWDAADASAATDADGAGSRRSPAGRDAVLVDRDVLTDKLCVEVVHRYRAIEGTSGDDTAASVQFLWLGEVTALRIALCLLHGWDPAVEADKEGRADELVMAWWQRNDPEYWAGKEKNRS